MVHLTLMHNSPNHDVIHTVLSLVLFASEFGQAAGGKWLIQFLFGNFFNKHTQK